MSKFIKRWGRYALVATIVGLGLSPEMVRAQATGNNGWWNGTGTSWGNTSSWYSSLDGMFPVTAPPGASDTANFNANGVIAAQIVNLDADQSALGLVFGNPVVYSKDGPVLIQSGALDHTLSIGSSGITVYDGAGGDTISSAVSLGFVTQQTWTNNSSNVLTVSGNISSLFGGGAGDGDLGGLVKTGAGTLQLSGNNTFSGGLTVQQGTLLVGSDSAAGTGTLTLYRGTTIQADGAARTLTNPLTLNDSAIFDGSLDLTLNGQINDTLIFVDLIKNGAGTLTLNGLIKTGGTITINSGTVAVNGYNPASMFANVNSSGNLQGTGHLAGTVTVYSGGNLSPGNNGPGVLSVGALNLNPGSQTNIELGGGGMNFNAIQIGGSATLGGTLNVSLLDGYRVLPGNSFQILQFAPGKQPSTTFNSVILPTLFSKHYGANRILWDSSQLYTTGTVSVLNTFYAGDLNRDGRVTVADIQMLMAALADLSGYQVKHGLKQPQTSLVADVNEDGQINNADIQALINLVANPQSYIVTGAGSGAGSVFDGGGDGSGWVTDGGGSANAVPEPATIVLFGIGALAIAVRRRAR